MKKNFSCPICGNSNPSQFTTYKGVPVCGLCFQIQNNRIEKRLDAPPPQAEIQSNLKMDYELSDLQQSLSDKVVENYKQGIDTLLYAVCGSGKTEVSFSVIDFAIGSGLKVAFALPRKDVVIELHRRLQAVFPTKKVVAVYGGHYEELMGDLVVLTTHQLFRYPNVFDLIVMDEVDAFPYAGNAELEAAFHKALKGHCLLMSATPSTDLVKEYSEPKHSILLMHTRFHQQPIPVPKAIYMHGISKYSFLKSKMSQYRQQEKPLFIFVPSINQAETLFKILSTQFPNGNYVSSKRENREEIIDDFRNGKYDYLVTTAILERGVTVKNLNVIIFGASAPIYDAASLVQIAGRAGRKHDAPYGDVYFIAERETPAIKKAISEIRYCNTFLSDLSKKNRGQ